MKYGKQRQLLSFKGKLEYPEGSFAAVFNHKSLPYYFDIYKIQKEIRTTVSSDTKIPALKFEPIPHQALSYSSLKESEICIPDLMKRIIPISEILIDENGILVSEDVLNTEKNDKIVRQITITRRISTIIKNLAARLFDSMVSDKNEENNDESQNNDNEYLSKIRSYLGKRKYPSRIAKEEAIKSIMSEKFRQQFESASEEEEIYSDNDDSSEISELSQDETETVKNNPNQNISPGGIIEIGEGEETKKKRKIIKFKRRTLGKKKVKEVKNIHYKKGKFNHLVLMPPPEFDNLEGISRKIEKFCCKVCSSRELVRICKNLDLESLKSYFKRVYCLGKEFKFGGETYRNSVIELLHRGDLPMLTYFLNNSPLTTQPDEFGIKSQNTGSNDKFAYGVKTRKVELGRGNRQGNMAFIGDDLGQNTSMTHSSKSKEYWINIERMIRISKPQILEMIINSDNRISYLFNLENMQKLALLVRTGNKEFGLKLANFLIKREGFGLSKYHSLFCTAEIIEELGKFREASLYKKPYGEDMIYPIFMAASLGANSKIFSYLYSMMSNKYVLDEKMQTILHYAAVSENEDNLKIILEDGSININILNIQKESALVLASRNGRHKNVRLLLKHGANWKKPRTREGYVASHYAAIENHVEVLKVMKEEGVNLSQNGKNGVNPLILAAKEGHFESVKYLVEAGISTVKKDKFKRTAAINALKNGYSKVASLLLKHGCPWNQPDSSDNYPLHYACGYGSMQAIDVLIKAGADINQYNSWKLTPIGIAMLKNHTLIIKKLLSYSGIDTNCKDDGGRTLISNTVRRISNENYEVAQLLITTHNCDLSIPDLSGNLPIHYLIQNFDKFFSKKYNYLSNSVNSVDVSLDMMEKEQNNFIKWFKLYCPSIKYLIHQNKVKQYTAFHLLIRKFTSLIINEAYLNHIKVSMERNGYIEVQSKILSSCKRYNNLIQTFIFKIFDYIKMLTKNHQIDGEKMEDMVQENQETIGDDSDQLLGEFKEKNQICFATFIEKMKIEYFKSDFTWSSEYESNQKNIKYRSNREKYKFELSTSICRYFIYEFDFDLEYQWKPLETQEIKDNKMTEEQEEGPITFTDNKPKQILAPKAYSCKGSAKSIIYQFLLDRWKNLLILPVKQELKQNQNSYRQYYSSNYITNSRNYYPSNSVAPNIWDQLKNYREDQVNMRHEFVKDLFELVKSTDSKLSQDLDIEKHLNIAQKGIEIIKEVIFIDPTTILDLKNMDSQTEIEEVNRFYESNLELSKDFIQQAYLGDIELKIESAGRYSSLIDSLVHIIGSVYQKISSQMKKSQQLEVIKSRISFISWILTEITTPSTNINDTITILNNIEGKKYEDCKLKSEKLDYLQSQTIHKTSLIKSLKTVIDSSYPLLLIENKFISLSSNWDKGIKVTDQVKEVTNISRNVLSSILEHISSKINVHEYANIRLDITVSTINTFKNIGFGLNLSIRKINPRKTDILKSLKTEEEINEENNKNKSLKLFNKNILKMRYSILEKLVKISNKMMTEDKPEYISNQSQDQMNKLCTSFISLLIYKNSIFDLMSSKSKKYRKIILLFQSLIESLETNMIETQIFTDYPINKYGLLNLMNVIIPKIALYFKTENFVNAEMINEKNKSLNMITLMIEQLFKEYDPKREIPELLNNNRMGINEDGSKYLIDVEECISQKYKICPLTKILYSGHQFLSQNEFITNYYDDLEKEFTLEEEILDQIMEYSEEKVMFILQLYKRINDIYNDSVKYGGVKSSMILTFLSRCFLIYQKGENEDKNKIALKLVDKNNSQIMSKIIPFFIDLLTKISRSTIQEEDNNLDTLIQIYKRVQVNKIQEKSMITFSENYFKTLQNMDFSLHTLNTIPVLFRWCKNNSVSKKFFKMALKYSSNPNPVLNNEEQDTLFTYALKHSNTILAVEILKTPNLKLKEFDNEIIANRLLDYLPELFKKSNNKIFQKFIDLFIPKIIGNESIVNPKRNKGYPLALRIVKDYQEYPEVIKRIFPILQKLGTDLNATFTLPNKLRKYIETKLEYRSLDLEGSNIIHYLISYIDYDEDCTFDILKFMIDEMKIDINCQLTVSKRTVLHSLFKSNDIEAKVKYQMMKLFLDKGANPNLKNMDQENLAFAPIKQNKYKYLDLLIEYDINLNTCNTSSESPLQLAIKSKDISKVEKLLELGASPNFKDLYNRNSLHQALTYSESGSDASFEIENLLIEKGAEINCTDNFGRTPLHYPFIKNQGYRISSPSIDPVESINSLLMSKNLELNQKDIFGFTPLMYAAQRGSLVCSLYLLEKGADINIKNLEGNNAFNISMINKYFNLAITLITFKAEWSSELSIYSDKVRSMAEKESKIQGVTQDQIKQIFESNQDQCTKMNSFRFSIRENWQGLAYMILSQGYNIGQAVFDSIVENKFKYTFNLLTKSDNYLEYQVVAPDGTNVGHQISLKSKIVDENTLIKILRMLKRKKINFSLKDNRGQTSIHHASQNGSLLMVKALIEEFKVDINEKDLENYLPFQIASISNNLDILQYLITETSEINKKIVDSKLKSPLHYLCYYSSNISSNKFIVYLIFFERQGYDFNLQDIEGKIPLHYFIKKNINAKDKVTFNFIFKRSDLSIIDNQGENLLMKLAIIGEPYTDYMIQLIKEKASKEDILKTDNHGRSFISNFSSSFSKYSNSQIQKIIFIIEDKFKELDLNQQYLFKVDKSKGKLNSLSLTQEVIDDYAIKEAKSYLVNRKMTLIDYFFLTSQAADHEFFKFLMRQNAKLDQNNELKKSSLHIILEQSKVYMIDMIYKIADERTKLNKMRSQNIVTFDLNFEMLYKNKAIDPFSYMILKNFDISTLKNVIQYHYKNIDFNLENSSGLRPIDYACSKGNLSVLLLLSKTQKKLIRNDDSMVQENYCRLDINTDLRNIMISNDLINFRYQTVFFYALEKQDIKLIKKLMRMGIDINQKVKDPNEDEMMSESNNEPISESKYRDNIKCIYVGKRPSWLILKLVKENHIEGKLSQVLDNFFEHYQIDEYTKKMSRYLYNDNPVFFKFDFSIKMKLCDQAYPRDIEVSPLFYAAYHLSDSTFFNFMLNSLQEVNFVDKKEGLTVLSILLLKSKRSMVKKLLDFVSVESKFLVINQKRINEVDWRQKKAKILNSNISFDKNYNQKLKIITKMMNNQIKKETINDDKEGMVLEDLSRKNNIIQDFTYPLLYMYDEGYSMADLILCIKIGADINQFESISGYNIIVKMILKNEDSNLKQLILHSKHAIDASYTDHLGKTPIHHIICSSKYGTYCNVSLLKFMAQYYDINKGDNDGFPPIYYARKLENDDLINSLIQLGAKDIEMSDEIKRLPTSVVNDLHFDEEIPNFEEDSDIAIKKHEKVVKRQKLKNLKKLIDPLCFMPNVQLVVHPKFGLFDCYLVKTDILRGEYSCNLFYRMQILYEINRDIYFLFNRWGRVGERGQHQTTAFARLEDVEEEFCKIFSQKSGNKWENKNNFTKISKKYRLMPFNREQESTFLRDFYNGKTDVDYPTSTLSLKVKQLLKEITSLKIYQNIINSYQFTAPIHKLDKVNLLKGIQILNQLKDLSADYKKVNVANNLGEMDYNLLNQKMEVISALTNDLMELVPSTKNSKRQSISPLLDKQVIKARKIELKKLIEIEVGVKILLGAQTKANSVHPLDYCYKCLNIKMVELSHCSLESKMIFEYINKSDSSHNIMNTNVYAIERNGEKLRYMDWIKNQKNKSKRKLLWHGSNTANFIGILREGLRIQPNSATKNGARFGNGIYLSDVFSKAENYTFGDLKMMILCEVAEGDQFVIDDIEMMKIFMKDRKMLIDKENGISVSENQMKENVIVNNDSILVKGRMYPKVEQEVITTNGSIIPLGDIVTQNKEESWESNKYREMIYQPNRSEYVIFNEAQIRMRYLIVFQ